MIRVSRLEKPTVIANTIKPINLFRYQIKAASILYYSYTVQYYAQYIQYTKYMNVSITESWLD